MKVHIILNSHLDPVWLWSWPQGLDEVLATGRTACDLLDTYPEITITRGEAWFYKMIHDIDKYLFARMQKYVANGRLQVVGGWWIQPDCNLPSAESFLKQAELSEKFFRDKLGVKATVGYNVDSFGHAATLPDFYTAAGIDSYVMMRPQEHEKKLPGDLFMWESPSGNRIKTFRISRAYCTTGNVEENIVANLDATLEAANEDVGHTMCFVGVGDHGGGPVHREIEWIKNNINYKPGVELVFSHPRAFFDAVEKTGVELPVVKDELQYHAIGCYSVVHGIKQNMRRAEALAVQAERTVKTYPGYTDSAEKEMLNKAWERILFNQFHDILAGSSIKTACAHTIEELGSACASTRDVIVNNIRRRNVKLNPCPDQQLIFDNLSNRDFSGVVEFEPWVGYFWATEEPLPCRITDMDEKPVLSQYLTPEAAIKTLRLATKLDIPAGGRTILRIKHDHNDEAVDVISASPEFLDNGLVKVQAGKFGIVDIITAGKSVLAGPMSVTAIEDESDTWSHGIPSYGTETLGKFKADAACSVMEEGNLTSSVVTRLSMEKSSLDWVNYLYADESIVRFRLKINWNAKQQIVKLNIPTGLSGAKRIDSCAGGELERKLDGWEYPFTGYSVLSGEGRALAVVSRDISAIDVQPDGTMRLTLLRSPYYAHHEPFVPADNSNYPVCDQGEHEYEIALIPMAKYSPEAVADEVARQQKPIWYSEITLGCKRKM